MCHSDLCQMEKREYAQLKPGDRDLVLIQGEQDHDCVEKCKVQSERMELPLGGGGGMIGCRSKIFAPTGRTE